MPIEFARDQKNEETSARTGRNEGHAAQAAEADYMVPATTSLHRQTPGSLSRTDVMRLQRTIGNRAVTRLLTNRRVSRQRIQRIVEVRPPGRGEASAFGRRQELIDRLNAQSAAQQYSLDGQVLKFEVVDEASLGNFERQMQGFINRAETVPMRLITSAGLVGGGPLLIDSLQEAYVDLDDMLGSDDLSFQMNLLHYLTERFHVRNYNRRVGTNMDADFASAHRAGIVAETEHLRSVVGDPTIRFVFEENQANGNLVFGYRSAEGYKIFHVFVRTGRAVSGGKVFVQTRDLRRLTIDELKAERAAAAAPAAVPAAGGAAPAPGGPATANDTGPTDDNTMVADVPTSGFDDTAAGLDPEVLLATINSGGAGEQGQQTEDAAA